MRWTPGDSGDNDIEDRRGDSGGGGFGGFGGAGGVRLGLGGFLVVAVLSLLFRQNFFALLSGPGQVAPATSEGRPAQESPEEHKRFQFMQFVMKDVQDTWTRVLPRAANVSYERSKLVLFRDSFPSACGQAESAIGPFYCPGDQKVYLDLGFFNELAQRFGAPGDFAQAYVIAHELGHHVQDLLGIERQVRQLQQRNPGARNQLSVRMELQADCLAGIWGNSAQERNLLDPGDLEGGLRAAAAVGDDRIQRSTRGTINPDSFTHGTSAQREAAFRKGFDSGSLNSCAAFTNFNR